MPTEADLDRAFDDGELLRTHVLRPTWHFALPEDIRMLLEVTGPRVHALNAFMYRSTGLDNEVRERSADLIGQHLVGGRSATRAELGELLQHNGIDISGLRLTYLVMHAELEAVICSGPRRGKQQTYALLDERAPGARRLPRDEALAEFAARYFTSHGPATVKDFATWSSLTIAEAKKGLAAVENQLQRCEFDGMTFYAGPEFDGSREPDPLLETRFQALQAYDEYVMGFSQSKLLFQLAEFPPPSRSMPNGVLVRGTQFAGSWRRNLTSGSVTLEAHLHRKPGEADLESLQREADRFGQFLGRTGSIDVIAR